MGEVNKNITISEEKGMRIVKRNMTLLLAGLLVSGLGSSIYSFAMSLYILEVTGSGLSFSLTLVLSSLPRIVLGPISGVIADKVDRKKLIVCMDILSGIIILTLLGFSMSNGLQISYIYIATFLLAISHTFFNTPLSSSLPNIVDEDNLTRVNSLTQSVMAIAEIAGPFIGGMVFALVDIRLFLLVNGISFILSGISESFIDFNIKAKLEGKKEAKPITENTFWVDFKDGLSYIKGESWLIWFSGFAIILNMVLMIGVSVPMPYIATNVLEFSSVQYGIMNTMFGIGILIGSLIQAVRKQPKNPLKQILVCIMIMGIGIMGMGIVVSESAWALSNNQYLILLMIGFLTVSMSAVFVNVPLSVIRQREVPNEKLGRVTGVLGTLSSGFTPIGAIIGGILVDTISPWMLPVGSGIIIVIVGIMMSKAKALKRLETMGSKEETVEVKATIEG